MQPKFDIFAIAGPTGWSAVNAATGATGSGDASAALAGAGAWRGARLLIASESVFAQTVRLPETQSRVLSAKEMESALFYEVEPFCGLAREDAIIAFSRAGAGEWRVSVASKSQMEGFRGDAEANGMRLAGVAALPPEYTGRSPQDTFLALFPDTGEQAPVIPDAGGVRFGRDLLVRYAAIAVAAVAAFCLCDWIWLGTSMRRLRPRLAASEEAAAANESIRRAAAADESRVRELEAAAERREAAAAELAAARDRWLALLAAFAEASGSGFAVASLESDGGAATATCIAPSASAAGAAMARMSSDLVESGWAVAPGRVEERPGGMASFSFDLEYAGKVRQ